MGKRETTKNGGHDCRSTYRRDQNPGRLEYKARLLITVAVRSAAECSYFEVTWDHTSSQEKLCS
jgi:hypothetical protein